MDLDDPVNADGVRSQALGDDESIELHVVDVEQGQELIDRLGEKGCVPDAFVGCLFQAIELFPWFVEMGMPEGAGGR